MPAEDELVDRLRTLLAGDDPVPAEVIAVARACHEWSGVSRSDLDGELAALVADSLFARESVRGDAPRLLTFRAGTRTVELEVSEPAGRLRIAGQLIAPGPARVRAEWPGGSAETEADPHGGFTFDDLVPGPIRFRCAPPGEAPVRTEWMVL